MNQDRKLREAAKAANRQVFIRSIILMVVFGAAIFIPLIWQLYQIQIVRHDELEEMAVRQQTSQESISASRGTIYDANGNVLAISSTAYDVIISPKAIREKQDALNEALLKAREEGQDTAPYSWNVETIVCSNLARILELNEGDLREKCADVEKQYKRLAIKVDQDKEAEIRELMESYSLSGCIYLQPNTKRYYPYGSMAAQVIGFVNDNGGAYGLEAMFESRLSGQAGLVVTAKNANGTDLMNFFQDYYDAQNGEDFHLTIDAVIQRYCESYLEKYTQEYDCQNGSMIIVQECKTGAILGMAQSPGFDLNNYTTVTDPLLLERAEAKAKQMVEESEAQVKEAIAAAELSGEELSSEERTPITYDQAYQTALSEAVYNQWTNKAITETYEPGSTFKALVLAAGLEEGVVDENTTFDCNGKITLGDWEISCSARYGHGTQTLAEAVGHSCNPAMFQIAQKLGKETFYDYFYRFGIMEPTGIDLPYEGTSNVWPFEKFGTTNLCTAAFGQRFTVTPIQLINAFNAVVNGGYLYTPYVVDSIVDQEGNVTYSAEGRPVRQVISNATSQRCRAILEGVVDEYTGKNAKQAGYRIGGKTGTSQTLITGEDICSFVGFAPADDPEVIVLVIFDRPKNVGGFYTEDGIKISGSRMAAPVAGELLVDILDYRGYEKSFTEDDITGPMTAAPNLFGKTVEEANEALDSQSLYYRRVGSGETVTGQIPSAGTYIPQNSTVILYMGEDVPTTTVEMPNLKGMGPIQAQERLNELGIFMNATGALGNKSIACISQSVEPGTMVKRGITINVQFGDNSMADGDRAAG